MIGFIEHAFATTIYTDVLPYRGLVELVASFKRPFEYTLGQDFRGLGCLVGWSTSDLFGNLQIGRVVLNKYLSVWIKKVADKTFPQ